jgi:hypothetical protein
MKTINEALIHEIESKTAVNKQTLTSLSTQQLTYLLDECPEIPKKDLPVQLGLRPFTFHVRNRNNALGVLTVNEISQELANKEAKRRAKKQNVSLIY